jgi:ABC-type phosphate transport system substrate-binding protein
MVSSMIRSVLGLFLLAGACLADETLAVIVPKSSGIDSLSASDLQRIFKGEKAKGPDGVKLVVVMREAGSAERDAALAGIYKMGEADYNKYFLQATFTGAVQAAPKSLSSPAAMKAFVGTTTGAIGYVKSADADDSVKVVKVDGKAPSDPGYPLKLGAK